MKQTRKGAKRPSAALSAMERDVMKVVWALGEAGSGRIIQTYTEKRPLAANTIRTVLANLREKGYVEVVPSIGREYVYRPVVRRETVARATLRDIIGTLFRGSAGEAVLCLLENESISDEEINEIRQRLDAMKDEEGRR